MSIAVVKTDNPQLEPWCDVSHPDEGSGTEPDRVPVYKAFIFSERIYRYHQTSFLAISYINHSFISVTGYCRLSFSHDGWIYESTKTSGIMPPPRSIQESRFWFGCKRAGMWIWL